MGQQFLNVVYGVKWTDEIDKAMRVDPNDNCSDIVDFSEHVDGIETGPSMYFIGVSIATGGYAEDGELEIDEASPFYLSELEKVLKPQLAAAKKTWTKLAAWSKKYRKFVLPKPGLMLAQVERA